MFAVRAALALQDLRASKRMDGGAAEDVPWAVRAAQLPPRCPYSRLHSRRRAITVGRDWKDLLCRNSQA